MASCNGYSIEERRIIEKAASDGEQVDPNERVWYRRVGTTEIKKKCITLFQ